MANANYLSEDDVNKLQDLFDRVRELEETRRFDGYGNVPQQDYQSPEVLVCLVPPSGIPGLSYITVQSVDCEVQRVLRQDDGTEQVVDVGFTVSVCNLTCDNIPGNTLVLAVQDRFGSWIATPMCPLQQPAPPPGPMGEASITASATVQAGAPFQWYCVKPPGV